MTEEPRAALRCQNSQHLFLCNPSVKASMDNEQSNMLFQSLAQFYICSAIRNTHGAIFKETISQSMAGQKDIVCRRQVMDAPRLEVTPLSETCAIVAEVQMHR